MSPHTLSRIISPSYAIAYRLMDDPLYRVRAHALSLILKSGKAEVKVEYATLSLGKQALSLKRDKPILSPKGDKPGLYLIGYNSPKKDSYSARTGIIVLKRTVIA